MAGPRKVYTAIVSIKPSDEQDDDSLMEEIGKMDGVIFAEIM